MNIPQDSKLVRDARKAPDVQSVCDASSLSSAADVMQRPVPPNRRRRLTPYLAFLAILLSSMAAAATLASADTCMVLAGLY